MNDTIKLTAFDFPDLENCRDADELEEQFKKELEQFMVKFKVKDYIISIPYVHNDKNNAVTIIEAGDGFISTHIDICTQALNAPGRSEEVN